MTAASNDEIRILTPSGMLGYGFPVDHFKMGLALKPHAITIDSGSTNSGPQKLGLGEMTCSREAYVKDIEVLLEAQHEAKIPAADLLGRRRRHQPACRCLPRHHRRDRPAGAAGASSSPRSTPTSTRRHISRELKAGRIEPLGPVPPLDQREIDAATVVVAQIGAEPFLKALDESEGVDVVVSGRSYDPSPTAAMAIRAGFDPALAWHMGKIMECGALCAEPVGRNVMGYLRRDHFEIEPLNPAERCTTASVAAHTLYEKTHPVPAGRSRRHARPVELQVRAGDRPARARLGQPLRARQALHGEARRRQDLGLSQHLHRRRARSDLHRPDRRDPGQGHRRHPRLFRGGAGGEPTASSPISTARTA